MARTTEGVRLLEADPELGALLSPARRAHAERELVVSTHRLSLGPWDVTWLSGAKADHVGLLVLDGVLSRELAVADQLSTELLGPGDLVRPWQRESTVGLLPVQAVWSVLSTVTLAVLDRRFAAEAARYPEITAALFDRLDERSVRLATTQAISQLTRVDRRLMALFWHLAERWGRVSGDGVLVPLALTHRILGQLVGARRPTVSTALSELANREELIRRPDGSWLLRDDPPDAETRTRPPTTAELRGHNLMRPPRRLSRGREQVDPDQLIAATDPRREALDPERASGAARAPALRESRPRSEDAPT
jgi:CRP/FNR family cyclic AMP-dependent transcriptional regulator